MTTTAPAAARDTAAADLTPDPRAWLAAPALASALCLALGWWAVPALSVTVDEWGYIHHGLKFWFFGDDGWLISSGVNPVFAWLQNAPGAAYLAVRYGALPGGPGSNFGLDLSTPDQLLILRMARATNLLLSGPATVWAVWAVSKRYFGPRAAAASAFLAAVEPNVLAAVSLATTDALIVPVLLAAMLAYDSYLSDPKPRRLLAVAALVGLGAAWKVSVLPIGLLLAGSCFVARGASEYPGVGALKRAAAGVGRFVLLDVPVVVVLAFLVSWAANGFLLGPLLGADGPNRVAYKVFAALGYHGTALSAKVAEWQAIRVPAPVSVFRSQLSHSWGGHAMMFLGKGGMHGPWYYYPYVFAMKTHVVLLALGFLALADRRVWRTPLPLAAFLLVVLSCRSKIHMGPRYFLTLYALWCASAGAAVDAALRFAPAGFARVALAASLAVGSLALTVRTAPDYLTHTSPLWGGDAEGYRYADANYDWAQGLFLAFEGADRAGLNPVCFLAPGDPNFGVPAGRDVVHAGEPTGELLRRLRGKFVAVPVRLTHGAVEGGDQRLYRALKETPPAGRLTNTCFYYDFRDPERFAELERRVGASAGGTTEGDTGPRSDGR